MLPEGADPGYHTCDQWVPNQPCIVLGYDNFVILAEVDGKQMLIYKHAVSTITPQRRIVFTNQEPVKEEE